jgi:hypothetical protein
MLPFPSPPRRAWLQSFSLAIGLSGGLMLGSLLAIVLSGPWFTLGPLLGLALAVVGLLRPHVMVGPYGMWNRLSGFYMRAARFIIKAICFYVLVLIVGQAGSSLRLTPPDSSSSLWRPREPGSLVHPPDPVVSPHSGWTRSFIAWALRSGQWWALGLLPFLIILAALDTDSEGSLPSATYTLY